MRTLSLIVAGLTLSSGSLCATTLERLSLEEMITQSTSIVRGKVLDSASIQRGPIIYTTYRFQVTDRLKGQAPAVLEVAVPGGALGGLRQSFAGTPRMAPGAEYVIFVWTGNRGVNHIIGLSQGLFDVKLTASGEVVLRRGAVEAHVVDRQGREVSAGPMEVSWRDLVNQVGGREAAR